MSGADAVAAADLALALELADRADAITTSHLGRGRPRATLKPDGSPVTAADVEVEETLLGLVGARDPGAGFLGEEVGPVDGSSGRRWIVDGIDGTHAFVAGRPRWGTLVALEDAGSVVVGVATSPGLGARWWAARGSGAWTAPLVGSEAGDARPLRVAPGSPAAVVRPPRSAFADGWRGIVHGRLASRFEPPASDGYGPLLVAAGGASASVHLDGGPWDHAPLVVIVEEAGGRFSDLWGGRRLDTRTAVFTDGSLHDAVLALVAPDRPATPEVFDPGSG